MPGKRGLKNLSPKIAKKIKKVIDKQDLFEYNDKAL